MDAFVYLWENKVNGKKYIGSHVGSLDDGYVGSGKVFNRALKKYGIENFERTILEHTTRNMVQEREQHYLDQFDAANNEEFYNLKSKVGGGWEYVNTDDNRQAAGERITTWVKENGHPRGMLGKHHTEENWKKTRAGWKDWADKNLKRPVIQMTLDEEDVQEFESITAAAKAVNGNPSNIKYTIEGKFKKAYGYKWRYKNDKCFQNKS